MEWSNSLITETFYEKKWSLYWLPEYKLDIKNPHFRSWVRSKYIIKVIKEIKGRILIFKPDIRSYID
jgi:hypothetical protein